MIKNWLAKRAAKKALQKVLHQRYLLHTSNIFTKAQRKYLASLIPDSWCHVDNIPQTNIIRIAAAMAMFGFTVENVKDLRYCMYVLMAQRIYEIDETNPCLIKRIKQQPTESEVKHDYRIIAGTSEATRWFV